MIKGALGDALQVGAYGIPVGATGNILKTFGQGAIAKWCNDCWKYVK